MYFDFQKKTLEFNTDSNLEPEYKHALPRSVVSILLNYKEIHAFVASKHIKNRSAKLNFGLNARSNF